MINRQNSGASEHLPLRQYDHEGLMVEQPHDGLEVAHTPQNYYSHLQVVPQSHQPFSSYSVSSSQPEKEWYSPSGAQPQSPPMPAAAAKRRKRMWFAVAALVAIVVVVAAILGGVLGSQAARNKNNANATQPAQSGQRIRSKLGAWNGTGIAMIFQGMPYQIADPGIWGSAYYQDWTGALTYQPFIWNGTIAPTNDPPRPIMVEDSSGDPLPARAANGTGIGGTWFDVPTANYSKYIVSYVDENNILTDIWTDSSKPYGPWKYGNLSAKGWKAPTDNRPAMLLQQDWSVAGKQYGTGGFRLYSGGMDGQIHQYSYDMASGEWADEDYILQGSYAYGGIMRQGYNEPAADPDYPGYYANNTLYTADQHGQVMYYLQHVNNISYWPVGGTIDAPVMSGKYAAINSSLVEDQRLPWTLDNNVYFPSNSSGKMDALSLTGVPASSTGLFTGEAIQVPSLEVMPGTSFAQFIDGKGPTYMIYQDTGNSLAWATVKGASIVQSGRFLPPSNPSGGT